MEDASKAKASIAALNDFNLKGSRIRVEASIYSEILYIIECVYLLDVNNSTSKVGSSIVSDWNCILI